MEVNGSGRSVVGAVRDAMRRYRDQPLGDLPDPGSPLALRPDGSAVWVTEISASDSSGLRCPLCGGPLSLTGDGASRRLAHEGACNPEGAASLARVAALDALREAGMAAFAPLTEFRDGEDVPLPVPGEDLACDRSGEVVRVIRFAEARDDGSGAGIVVAAEGGGEVTILAAAARRDREDADLGRDEDVTAVYDALSDAKAGVSLADLAASLPADGTDAVARARMALDRMAAHGLAGRAGKGPAGEDLWWTRGPRRPSRDASGAAASP